MYVIYTYVYERDNCIYIYNIINQDIYSYIYFKYLLYNY